MRHGCLDNGNIPNLTYRSANWSSNINWNTQWNAAASFVTGSHNIKVGYQGALLYDDRKNYSNDEFLSYRVQERRARSVDDERSTSSRSRQRVRSDAFYAQEQWTMGRVTFQGALRYDHAWSYFPEQTVGPVRFFPTAVTYPHTKGVEGYHDLWPRARRRLRRVRDRQDVAQGQLRPLPRGGAERRPVHRAQPDLAAVDDREPRVDRQER